MSMAIELAKRLNRPPKILVVDDEAPIRMMFDRLNREVELELKTVSSPLEAVNLIEREHFDAIFIDMKFPEAMDGMDVLRQINKLNCETHVIIMSGSINLHDVMAEANRLGVVSFMLKPVTFTVEFLKKIMSRLGIRVLDKEDQQAK